MKWLLALPLCHALAHASPRGEALIPPDVVLWISFKARKLASYKDFTMFLGKGPGSDSQKFFDIASTGRTATR